MPPPITAMSSPIRIQATLRGPKGTEELKMTHGAGER